MSAIILFAIRFYIYDQSSTQVTNISETVKHKLALNGSLNAEDLLDISQMNENIDMLVKKDAQIVFNTAEIENIPIDYKLMTSPQSLESGEVNIIFLNESFTDDFGDVFSIQIIKDMDNDREFIKMVFWMLFMLNIAAFFVSTLLGYFMSKRALNPIEKIVNQAKEITVNDLSKRISIDGPDDELKRLSETFNDMIGRIEKGYEKQNRFALDASHELSTPLAVIKGYVDIIGRWGMNDPEVYNEAIEAMKNEIKNMTGLLDKLLFIAKNDNDISRISKSEFWLNELMVEIYKESKFIHPSFNIILQENQSVLVNADRNLIKQMMRAILDNSVKYSTFGATIQIQSKVLKDNFEIEISDEGMGIDAEDLSLIFDRFYRVDKARTRDIGGSGLGLAIVKWIAAMHGGSVMAMSTVNVGTTIKISIPQNFKTSSNEI